MQKIIIQKMDRKFSQEVTSFFKFKKQFCFNNAFQAAMEVFNDCYYIEGFAILDKTFFEHGWIEYDGKVVDPTFANLNRKYEYVPVNKYSHAQLERMAKRKKLVLFPRFKYDWKERERMIEYRFQLLNDFFYGIFDTPNIHYITPAYPLPIPLTQI